MQKQSMTRALAFLSHAASAIGFWGASTKEKKRFGKVPPQEQAPTRSFGQCTGNAGAYGASIVGGPRYRAYKIKRNRRARAACGGTLPKKFK